MIQIIARKGSALTVTILTLLNLVAKPVQTSTETTFRRVSTHVYFVLYSQLETCGLLCKPCSGGLLCCRSSFASENCWRVKLLLSNSEDHATFVWKTVPSIFSPVYIQFIILESADPALIITSSVYPTGLYIRWFAVICPMNDCIPFLLYWQYWHCLSSTQRYVLVVWFIFWFYTVHSTLCIGLFLYCIFEEKLINKYMNE